MLDLYLYILVLLVSSILIVVNIDKDQLFFKSHQYFAVLMVITSIVEVAGLISTLFKLRNFAIYNFFLPFQAMFLAVIFFRNVSKSFLRRSIVVFLFLFPFAVLMNTIFFQGFTETFQSYTFLIGGLFMIYLSISYFYELFSNPVLAEIDILQLPFFWISTGMLFYFSGAFLWGGYVNFFIDNDYVLAGSISRITTILASLMYTLFAIGFSCHKLFRTSPSS